MEALQVAHPVAVQEGHPVVGHPMADLPLAEAAFPGRPAVVVAAFPGRPEAEEACRGRRAVAEASRLEEEEEACPSGQVHLVAAACHRTPSAAESLGVPEVVGIRPFVAYQTV